MAGVLSQPGLAPRSTAELVEWLSSPRAYPHPTSAVEVVETHISWVFLTDRCAYKLKKPVHFDFVDFRQPAQRLAACRDEVALNRRLAPRVYLGVVPITCRDGRLRLGGEGPAVEWLVHMRRLPNDRTLEAMLERGCVAPEDIGRLAAVLTEFYQRLPPLTVCVDRYCGRLREHIRDNLQALGAAEHDLPENLVQPTHAAQLRLLALRPELVGDRAVDGRIVEGHGDLRPEHVYFLPEPTIIDCLEFNQELRQLDVLDELCFLAMECDFHGAPRVGSQLIEHYCQVSGDHPPAALRAFYKSYRAAVRAKVACLRADQHRGGRRRADRGVALRYLELAGSYAAEFGPPLLLIMRGVAGTGKSSLARRLAERLSLKHLQTDAIRQECFGPSRPGEEAERYRPENRRRVYERMLGQARFLLAAGWSVVLDGTFLTAEGLNRAAEIGRGQAARVWVFECRCPADVAVARIRDRLDAGGSPSEATPQQYFRQQRQVEPIPPELPACALDTTAPLPELLERVCGCLRSDDPL